MDWAIAAVAAAVVGVCLIYAFVGAPEFCRISRGPPSRLVLTDKERRILAQSASSLARMIRTGVVTCEESYLVQLKWALASNKDVRAIVALRPGALDEAKQADATLRRLRAKLGPAVEDVVGPFFGVGISVKECIAVTSMPQTSGLLSRLDAVAEQDATVISRLRLHVDACKDDEVPPRHRATRPFGHDHGHWMLFEGEHCSTRLPVGKGAGFIPLWSTNLSELCMWYEASNPVYGCSNNPYDLTRTVGGSSGGEGAAIAMGGAPVGVGSDVGGSIRMPAAFNGVFGHKPSGGLVPNSGQYPFSTSRILSTGPLARYAEDLWPMLAVMAGANNGTDAACRGVPLSVFGTIEGASAEADEVVRLNGPKATVVVPAGHDSVPSAGTPWVPEASSSREGKAARARSSSASRARRHVPARERKWDQVGRDSSVHGDQAWTRYSQLNRPVQIACVSATPALFPSAAARRGPSAVDWSKVRVCTVPQVSSAPPLLSSSCLSSGILAAVEAAATTLAGWTTAGVESVDVPELSKSFDLWSSALQADHPTPFAQFLADDATVPASKCELLSRLACMAACAPCTAACAGYHRRVPGDVDAHRGEHTSTVGAACRSRKGCGRHTVPAIGLGLIEDIPGALSPDAQRASARELVALRDRLQDALEHGLAAGGGGILVFPVHPTPAPPHSLAWFRFLNTAYTSLINALTFPATVVPVHIVDKPSDALVDLVRSARATPGPASESLELKAVALAHASLPPTTLPLAVQVVGSVGADHLTIAAAERLDQRCFELPSGQVACFGWRPPPACAEAGIVPSLRE
jgi:Asp-tRNA(Asn)/Glu-tRNA(Gln) amidotransferase A subunit family amidase